MPPYRVCIRMHAFQLSLREGGVGSICLLSVEGRCYPLLTVAGMSCLSALRRPFHKILVCSCPSSR